MTRLAWHIGARYMGSRRSSRLISLISFIAMAGVAVGVTALVVVIGVMNGLQNELREKILIASPHLRILTYGSGLRIDDWREALDVIREHPDVEAAAPFVISQGLLRAGADHTEGARVLGIPSDTGAVAVTPLARHFLTGDLRFHTESSDVEGGIILGSRLAQRLIASDGDELTVISSAGSKFNAAVGGFIPSYWTFEVAGRFETGMFEYDHSYVVLPIEVAQRFASLGDAVSGIDVRVRDPEQATRVGAELVEEHGYPYRSSAWQEQNAQLFAALKLEKIAMGLILLLIVVVAAFNIVGTLTMVVTDKTREIGILRAMGLPARSVRRIFIWQGFLIGGVGTAVGAGVGLMFARLVDAGRVIPLEPSVYFIDHLPVQVQATDFGIILLASLAVAVGATIYPSRQAADLHPVDAIRHE